MNGLFRRGWITAGAAVLLAAAAPAVASAAPAKGAGNPCSSSPLSEPFLAWGDPHQYALLPGESVDNVDGAGWRLSGGAQLVTTTLDDGTEGQVLDMPTGSVVVTPPMCVNGSDYPLARTMVSDLTGTEGVAVYVTYDDGNAHSPFLPAGNIKNALPGWYPSRPVELHSGALRGTHQIQFALVAYAGEYQLYNFYVDPRRSH